MQQALHVYPCCLCCPSQHKQQAHAFVVRPDYILSFASVFTKTSTDPHLVVAHLAYLHVFTHTRLAFSSGLPISCVAF